MSEVTYERMNQILNDFADHGAETEAETIELYRLAREGFRMRRRDPNVEIPPYRKHVLALWSGEDGYARGYFDPEGRWYLYVNRNRRVEKPVPIEWRELPESTP